MFYCNDDNSANNNGKIYQNTVFWFTNMIDRSVYNLLQKVYTTEK